MPKSKLRKKVAEQRAHNQEVDVATPHELLESPRWLAPTMVAAFLVGLFWIVTFYVTQTQYPIPGIGAWNMIVGFRVSHSQRAGAKFLPSNYTVVIRSTMWVKPVDNLPSDHN